ncbi:hypothetical protein PFISCL1PPCAC_28900 [Pristionchus fissidentatus]|uniref:Endonuclease/exonuclease/phosphatase domain-containing protein n=1 Tax=Pristionchus fissidentatus TaxID=1538716 RepID=A0AAV5W4I9_9BILA|nr:hypothetical protein PFISCL1PPCAC_16897 [Pristionchus fissidentatus]GMT37603.1 hypothetical protein PFISCL1PPCAC_28900 [Pristionchus fissidentatus]
MFSLDSKNIKYNCIDEDTSTPDISGGLCYDNFEFGCEKEESAYRFLVWNAGKSAVNMLLKERGSGELHDLVASIDPDFICLNEIKSEEGSLRRALNNARESLANYKILEMSPSISTRKENYIRGLVILARQYIKASDYSCFATSVRKRCSPTDSHAIAEHINSEWHLHVQVI